MIRVADPWCLIAAWVGLGCCAMTMGQKLPDKTYMAAAEYRSHFEPNPGASPESGSRDGWESYPISQETGYDPSIQPETSNGESVLVRDLAPTHDGLFQLGFIRRLNMVSGADASMRFRLRAPYLAHPAAVHVSVFRGGKEERHDAILQGPDWQEIAMPIDPSSAPITAVAMSVDFADAVKGRLEKVMLRDVRLKALTTKRIALIQPQTLWDASRELYYLQSSVLAGADLSIEADVEKTSSAHWSLTAPAGQTVAQGSGGRIRHHFAVSDEPGIWTVHISDDHAVSTALLLLRSAQPRGLLFDRSPAISSDLLKSIRERRALLEKTTDAAAGMNVAKMDPHWLLPGLPSYFSIILQPSELAMLNAMEYRATGDRAALSRSRELLGNIVRWPLWVHPWFPAHGYHSYYPVGIMTKYVVMAEQFLGDDLAIEDRRGLDRSLMELSVKPIYEEYVLEDRLQFNTSNWIGNTDGGALLAALQSEDPNAAGYAIGLFVKDRDHVKAAYTSDGGYGEGVTYHRFDLEMTTLVAETAKRLLGTSIDGPLLDGDRYMRYASYGKDGLLDYGDSHVDITPSNVFAYIAAQNRSADMTDFYYKYRDEGTAQIISRVLWEPKIKAAGAPAATPTSRLFEQRGIAVLRDSWSSDATVIAMRAGKNFNHNHADEGSVFYAHNGTLWLGEAGYADYYKDPSYSTFNIQAIGHNTLLVDGNGESQALPGNDVFGTYPTFTHSLIGKEASFVQADLTSTYGGVLQRYTRSLIYRVNGPLIVIDDVESKSPHIFTQVWHPEHEVAAFDPPLNRFLLTDGHTQLEVRSFGAGGLASVKRLSPLPLTSYEQAERGSIKLPVQFAISSRNPSTSGTIVTMIQPRVDGETGPEPAKWEEVPGGSLLRIGSSGLRISHERTEASTSTITSITAWWNDGAILINGTHYQDSRSDAGISADHPVDMSLQRSADGELKVEIDATQATRVTLNQLVVSEKVASLVNKGSCVSSANTICVVTGMNFMTLRPSYVKAQATDLSQDKSFLWNVRTSNGRNKLISSHRLSGTGAGQPSAR
jgi:hypothetical protein